MRGGIKTHFIEGCFLSVGLHSEINLSAFLIYNMTEEKKAYMIKWREKNKEKLRKYAINYGKSYRENNKEILKERKRKYYQVNSKEINERCKIKRELNKDKIKERNKKYRDTHKEEKKIRDKNYRNTHKKQAKLYQKQYRETHKEKLKIAKSIWNKSYRENNKEKLNFNERVRKKNDSLHKLRGLMRTAIGQALKKKGYRKNSKTATFLGCSFEFLKNYIESKFQNWMNWENHGKYNGQLNFGWDIDHIIPLCSAKTKKELIKLFHYTNLQPLCSQTNRYIKKDKF